MKRVALIEFDSSHDECLLTQVVALKKKGCWVALVTNATVLKRNAGLEQMVDHWVELDADGRGLTGAAIRDALLVRRVMRTLQSLNVEIVVFNTAQGGHVRNACLFSLFRKVKCVGIVHTIRKFQGSFTQGIIHLKIKRYFVLADFLLNQIPPQKKLRIASFYPIHFPIEPSVSFPQNEPIFLAIVGSVETRRKDLVGFIEILKQCGANVHFGFLGMANSTRSEVRELREILTKLNLLDRVELHEKHLSFEEMDQFLRKSCAVLSLIHPNTLSADQYFRNQIPGAMNLALAYKLPLLLHASFREIDELNTAAIYYTVDQFGVALEEIKTRGAQIHDAMRKHEKYSLGFQEEVYSNHVLLDE